MALCCLRRFASACVLWQHCVPAGPGVVVQAPQANHHTVRLIDALQKLRHVAVIACFCSVNADQVDQFTQHSYDRQLRTVLRPR